MLFSSAYAGKHVLLTGDTGFKGSWLSWWLVGLGAHVTGLALAPEHRRGPFVLAALDQVTRHVDGDIRDAGVMEAVLAESEPAFVFHLAAQALVRESYRDPVGTADTNVMGTVRVLDAVRRRAKPCVVVVITSDKCYENPGQPRNYSEDDAMGGYDLYSASKGCAELLTSAYRRSFFAAAGPEGPSIRVASARAGNVIGPGDWATDRILPDAMRALLAGQPLHVRNPDAVRPWQHVLEPLAGYLWLGARLAAADGAQFAEAWNFGPLPEGSHAVRELADLFLKAWGSGRWEDVHRKDEPHEAWFLQLSIEKAMARLNWRPVWDFSTAVRRTAEGYRDLEECGQRAEEVRKVLDREIEEYSKDARRQGVPWAG